jgi:hypothetical protein
MRNGVGPSQTIAMRPRDIRPGAGGLKVQSLAETNLAAVSVNYLLAA